MSEEKKCFIILPITTPEVYLDNYKNDKEHFPHVLKYLLIPSVIKAKYQPISPISKGSDLIQGEIIKQLESADLVLCDMSTLNPNVFFELGIRTALNKPVCVIKDEHTKIPFDTGILNHHEYRSSLNSWEINEDIDKLSKHIELSFTRSKGLNTLWRYFGAKADASPSHGVVGSEDKLDLLFLQMDSLRQKLESVTMQANYNNSPDSRLNNLRSWLSVTFDDIAITDVSLSTKGVVHFHTLGELSDKYRKLISNTAHLLGFSKIIFYDDFNEQNQNSRVKSCKAGK